MEDNMFYKAHPLIFKRAEELRNNPTDTEEILWNYLRQSQLGIKFRRQHPASCYVLDFYAHKIKLAIEIDGSIHALENVKKNDSERQAILEKLGIKFLRFTNTQIKLELEKVIFVINKKLQELKSFDSPPLGAEGLQIIPAIDIINGNCVRLTKGDFAKQKVYNENPLEVAKMFEDAGLQRLHIVDLDGAKAGSIQNLKILELIASQTKLVIDFGGGIKTIEDVNTVFNAGAAIVTLGSIAVKHPEIIEEWVIEFGADKILIGADVLDEKIKISGWMEDGGITIFEFIGKMLAVGITNIFCTDISRDGVLQGPSIALYQKIMQQFPSIHLIASGGVSSMDDILELKNIGCGGVIIGKAIYEEKITLKELVELNSNYE
ncbi:MAG TPA: 1-(5-phosphoribosyl)-5-[(5-phosphoribosylamino)methylideneamino]imidazole-4-carboxamide isomerase [Chitinophagaceae bacterium]|nr:1-(5-phosphoribosyl)-5-[(5-phosphoribosylamino)methylideneamino]imidazole-4-carboxamide isomerase [Chitinophagaceae bacterium]